MGRGVRGPGARDSRIMMMGFACARDAWQAIDDGDRLGDIARIGINGCFIGIERRWIAGCA